MIDFEVHITVDADDINAFVRTCHHLKVKPVVLELQSQSSAIQQVMTSSKHSADNYRDIVYALANQLSERFKVKRIKVEVPPHIDIDSLYFESHIRVRVTKDTETKLDALCQSLEFHKSRNIFKKIDDEFYWMMCTHRSRAEWCEFRDTIHKFTTLIQEHGFELDKIELEKCVVDTNEELDKVWLTNK